MTQWNTAEKVQNGRISTSATTTAVMVTIQLHNADDPGSPLQHYADFNEELAKALVFC